MRFETSYLKGQIGDKEIEIIDGELTLNGTKLGEQARISKAVFKLDFKENWLKYECKVNERVKLKGYYKNPYTQELKNFEIILHIISGHFGTYILTSDDQSYYIYYSDKRLV